MNIYIFGKKVFSFVYRKCVKYFLVRKFNKINLNSNSKLSEGNVASDVVVSLTTHGERIASVYITIESILNGKLKPGRLILWLDSEDAFNNLSPELVRLKCRGVEVKLSKNFGPHTKYYPYIIENDFYEYLITADDDIIYPSYWLVSLYEAAVSSSSNNIICHRAHNILFDDDKKFLPYNSWSACTSTDASIGFFATGVSGVIYPKRFQQCLFAAGDVFLNVCPKADDVWLHYISLREGFKIKQLTRKSVHFMTVDNTQHLGLMNSNVDMSQNDIQINKTYTRNDMLKVYLNK
ncbi:glycosyltransferase family 2 protein [Raoultella terrigena]|uniref:glycosyltransferase family 2 protein n=1 Tax=Raoultella terrigena TaxID=577 RepID=UPI001F52860A|nr:glycosyltransferase family 2 protein [Raoultella terrigena]MCI1030794.1 glycosyltransferase family 2 protein [Raoultella terrigena]